MENSQLKEKVKELTLMLLHLTSWEENEIRMQYKRSWKGYNFDVLNDLAEEEFIRDGPRSKSVIVTDEGVKKAKELLKQYGIDEK